MKNIHIDFTTEDIIEARDFINKLIDKNICNFKGDSVLYRTILMLDFVIKSEKALTEIKDYANSMNWKKIVKTIDKLS